LGGETLGEAAFFLGASALAPASYSKALS